MIANIYVPLWTVGVAWIALCFAPGVLASVRRWWATNRPGRSVGVFPFASTERRPFSSLRAGERGQAGAPFDWDEAA